MSYPMKEISTPFGASYREMTPQEYERTLGHYHSLIEFYTSSSGRLQREYGEYLKRWFSDKPCDGMESYEMRYRSHILPMAANTYMFE